MSDRLDGPGSQHITFSNPAQPKDHSVVSTCSVPGVAFFGFVVLFEQVTIPWRHLTQDND